jgi:acyl-CoA synthetase (AMP-forming)/AMP-acid ligase II
MGLLNLLYALYVGSHCVVLSPMQFLREPLCWLRAICHYRASYSGDPNFAYQICADRISPQVRADLDLSSWQFAFCGAEPVRRSTLEQFVEAFADSGFSQERFYPCYGLAEATLSVTLGRPAGPPRVLLLNTLALQVGEIESAGAGQEI